MDNCQQSSAASSSSLTGALKRSRSPTSGTEPRAKRVRTKWTESQITELCRYFAENTTPTTPQIAVLAGKIGLTVKVVQTYFRNQRKELKKQQREAEVPVLNVVICFPDTPVPVRQENDSTPSVAIMIPHVPSVDGSPTQLVNDAEVIAEDQHVNQQTIGEFLGDLLPDIFGNSSSDGMAFPAGETSPIVEEPTNDIDHFEESTSVLPFDVQMDLISLMADYPCF